MFTSEEGMVTTCKHKFKEGYNVIKISFHSRLLAIDQASIFQALGCIMGETMVEQGNSV